MTRTPTNILGGLLLLGSIAAQGPYSVTALPQGALPRDINDAGQITGFINGPQSTTRAFLFDPATGLTDIGALPGFPSAAAYALNDAGQVVGSSWPAVIARPGHAFLFTPGAGMIDLGEISGPTSEARCIDNHANIGGNADAFAFSPLAFYRPAGGAMAVVPGLGGNVEDLADAGWIVGADSYVTPGGSTVRLPPSPSTPLRLARAVNDSGQIAGEMSDASGSPSYGFRYDQGSGQLTNLGSISRFGGITDIDSKGTVVGAAKLGTRVDSDALISFGGGPLQPVDGLLVPGSGWDILTISAINERGQMVGTARFALGAVVGVRLDPVQNNPASSTLTVQGCRSGTAYFRATPPVLGRPWITVLAAATAAQSGATALTAGHHPPLSWPGGCATWLGGAASAVWTPFSTNAGGNTTRSLLLPDVAAWVGLPVTAQALLIEPTTPAGWTATQAAQLTLGR